MKILGYPVTSPGATKTVPETDAWDGSLSGTFRGLRTC